MTQIWLVDIQKVIMKKYLKLKKEREIYSGGGRKRIWPRYLLLVIGYAKN